MAKKSSPAGTPAILALSAAGVAYILHEYEHDPAVKAFGQETSEKLGVDPHRLFKTLITSCQFERAELVTAVVPVAGQLDLKALAAAIGAKRAELADPALAQRSTGYVVGGISPLGQKTPLRTVIDLSARDFATIYVSAGRRGQQIEVMPDDLARLTDGKFATIGR